MENYQAEEAGSIEEAANALESILEPRPTKTSREPSQTVADDDESEALDDENSTETQEHDAGEADNSSEDDSSTHHDEDEEEDYDPDQEVTVKINGKTEKVKLGELRDGYQKGRDYSHKSGELAEQRRAFEAHVHQVQQERAQYTQVIEAHQQQIAQGGLTAEQWQYLWDHDFIEYMKQESINRRRQEQYHALEQQKVWLANQTVTENKARAAEAHKDEQEKLFKALPALRDEKARERFKADIAKYGPKVFEGYSAEELLGASDSRAYIKMYHDLNTYKASLAKPRLAPAETTRAPQRMPVEAASSQVRPRDSALVKAKQRQKSSGSVEDTAAVIARLGL